MPGQELEIWIAEGTWGKSAVLCRIVDGLQLRSDHRGVDRRGKIGPRICGVIVLGDIQNVDDLRASVCISVCEVPRLAGRCQNRIVCVQDPRLLTHGKAAKEKELVLNNCSANASAKIIKARSIPG